MVANRVLRTPISSVVVGAYGPLPNPLQHVEVLGTIQIQKWERPNLGAKLTLPISLGLSF